MHWTAIRTPQRVILAHTLGDHSPEEAAQAVDDAGLNSEGGRLIQLTNEEAWMLAPWVSMRTTFSRGRVQVGETDQDGARRIFDAIEDQRELRRFHSAGHAPSFALVRFDAEHPDGWVIDQVMPADIEGHLARACNIEEQDFHAEARDLLRGKAVKIDGLTFAYALARPGTAVKDVACAVMEQTTSQAVDDLRKALSDAGEELARVSAERDDLKAKVAEATAVFDDMRRDIRNLRSERDDARRERDEARESRDGCKAAWKRDVAQMRQAHDDFVSAVRTDEKEAHAFLVARGFDGATALDSAKAAVDLYNKMNSMAGEEKGRYAAACQEIEQLRERTMAGVWIVAKAVRERGEVISVDYFANPLHRSAKAIESWTGDDADEIIRGAMAGNVVRVESRGLAKPETRDLVAVIAPSSEAAVMMARVKLGSAEERLIEEATAATPITAAMVARLKSELDEAKANLTRASVAVAEASHRAGVEADADNRVTIHRIADAAIQWGESSAIGKALANIAAYQGADDPEGYYAKALTGCLNHMRANGIRLGRAVVLCDESVAGVFEKIIEGITGEPCGSLPLDTVDKLRADLASVTDHAAACDAFLGRLAGVLGLRDGLPLQAIQRKQTDEVLSTIAGMVRGEADRLKRENEALLAALVRAEAAAKK